ncbi:hypothetical protein L204_102374 [Cryptococcus depauperatus]|nr:hypothetical protein L204_05922 [Cryptococcus depauperatus CBS 7855]
MVVTDQAELNKLLKEISKTSSVTLTYDEIHLIATSMLPSSPRSARAIAFLCLSKFMSDIEASTPDTEARKERIQGVFRSYIQSVLYKNLSAVQEVKNEGNSENSDPESCVPAIYLLIALYPFVPIETTSLLETRVGDFGDIIGILLELAELPSPLQPALAELFVTAADSPSGRNLALSRATEWLKGGTKYQNTGANFNIICVAALSKLIGSNHAAETPQKQRGDVESEATPNEGEEIELTKCLMQHIEESPASSTAVQSAVEGLAVLSLKSKIKVLFASSQKFLNALVKLSPRSEKKGGSLPVTPRGSIYADDESKVFESVDTRLCYGLTTILVNLSSKRPIMSETDKQIAQLRRMAISANKNSVDEYDTESVLESIEAVNLRSKAIFAAGIVSGLSGLVKADSKLVKEGIGILCRNLLDLQDTVNAKDLLALKLSFVREGGFKALSNVIRDLLLIATIKLDSPQSNSNFSPSTSSVNVDLLPAIQALAKLIISIDPSILFPPPLQTTCLNALTPLYHLLIHPDSLSIQRFESLMALTNMATIDASIGTKIVQASLKPLGTEGFLKNKGDKNETRVMIKIEELIIDDNELTRRAAVQLMCNLASCEAGYNYLTGEDGISSLARARSRLSILMVMACVDDVSTRSAAGGTLAMITESKNACKYILMGDIASSDPLQDSVKTQFQRSPWSRIASLLEPIEEVEYDENGETIPIISSTSSVPNPELVHRGAIILYNLLEYVVDLPIEERKREKEKIKQDAIQEKLMNALQTAKEVGNEITQPIVECLRHIREQL